MRVLVMQVLFSRLQSRMCKVRMQTHFTSFGGFPSGLLLRNETIPVLRNDNSRTQTCFRVWVHDAEMN
jgi:hypothetical protein